MASDKRKRLFRVQGQGQFVLPRYLGKAYTWAPSRFSAKTGLERIIARNSLKTTIVSFRLSIPRGRRRPLSCKSPNPKLGTTRENRQSVIQCSFAQPRKTRSCLKGDSELSVGGLGCFRRVVTRRWSGTRMAVNEVLVHPDLARLSSLRANVRLDSARQSEYTIHVCASSSRPTSHITSGLT